MPFDIYGGELRRGHCEVHPWVHEPYPCSVCYMEAQHEEDLKRLHSEIPDPRVDEYNRWCGWVSKNEF